VKKIKMCILCGNMRIQGYKVLEQWVCDQCESDLLDTDVEHPYYQYYMESVKNMWKSHYLIRRGREGL